ncbi:TPA: DUF4037 domain-containing protein [Streptococcus agalactiae]
MDHFTKLWQDFSKLPNVVAIALGGSRSGDSFDQSSDYDLYVYCAATPDITSRKRILNKHCHYIELNNHYWELEDNSTLNDGTDIDILYRNIDNFLSDLEDVVEHHNSRIGYTTCFWHNLINCQILYDPENQLQSLKERFEVSYPSQLQKQIIIQNRNLLTGKLPSYDKQIIKALKRQDFVSTHHRTTAFLDSYFDIIFALNKLTHPGEKRMISYAKKNATLLPKHFEENIIKLCHHNSNEHTVKETLNDIIMHLDVMLKENFQHFIG